MSEENEKSYKFTARVMVLVGFAVACMILGLWIIKMAPGIIKLVGFVAALFSIYVGWAQLSSLKKESPEGEEDKINKK